MQGVNCASATVQLAQQCEWLKSEARASMEHLTGFDRRLEDNISATASLKERLDVSNSRIAEMNSRLSATTGRLAQMEPAQKKQNEELSHWNARHLETKLRLNIVDERMRKICSVTDKLRDAMNSLSLRVERVEPEQEKQREYILQINMALEAAMHQITASQRLGEDNHRKFRLFAEARERIDRKDQQTFDSLNSSMTCLSVLLKETVHRVNIHASHLKISSIPIQPGTPRLCSERFDGLLPYRSTSQASTRRESGSSCSHDGRPSARPASAGLHKESHVPKQALRDVPTRHLPEIQQPLPTETA